MRGGQLRRTGNGNRRGAAERRAARALHSQHGCLQQQQPRAPPAAWQWRTGRDRRWCGAAGGKPPSDARLRRRGRPGCGPPAACIGLFWVAPTRRGRAPATSAKRRSRVVREQTPRLPGSLLLLGVAGWLKPSMRWPGPLHSGIRKAIGAMAVHDIWPCWGAGVGVAGSWPLPALHRALHSHLQALSRCMGTSRSPASRWGSPDSCWGPPDASPAPRWGPRWLCEGCNAAGVQAQGRRTPSLQCGAWSGCRAGTRIDAGGLAPGREQRVPMRVQAQHAGPLLAAPLRRCRPLPPLPPLPQMACRAVFRAPTPRSSIHQPITSHPEVLPLAAGAHSTRRVDPLSHSLGGPVHALKPCGMLPATQ